MGSEQNLHVTLLDDGATRMVNVRGEVDASTAEHLAKVLAEAVRRGPPVLIDLTDTVFMSAAGVRAILEAHSLTGRDPDAVMITGARNQIERVLQLCETDNFPRILPDADP